MKMLKQVTNGSVETCHVTNHQQLTAQHGKRKSLDLQRR